MSLMANALQRKLTPPSVTDGYLRRERLLGRLREGLLAARRLTMVGGSAGTGKTTLLADYHRLTDATKLWFSLSPSEADAVVFYRSLLAALHGLFPALPSTALEVLDTMGNRGLVQAASLLCDGLLEQLSDPLVLIIDNTQHLPTSREAQEALEVLISLFPEESQLILSGRSFPALKLAHYRLGGQVVELGTEDLALDRGEISALLIGKGGEPASAEVVDKLYERTKGWVTGIVYATAAEATAKRLEQPDLLYSFLAEEIFDRWPRDFQDHLLLASFLPHLDAETCRNAMGLEAESFLEVLSHHRDFITRRDDGFEFHPLFREFLQREALVRWKRDRRETLLGKLADVATSPDEAVRLLLLGENWTVAERRLVAALSCLLRDGQTGTIQSLLDGFPASWRKQSAWLNYMEGELARRGGNLSRAIESLQSAEALSPPLQPGSPRPWIWASLAAAYGARGDYEKQQGFAQRAIQASPPDPGFPLAFCFNVLGLYHLSLGDLVSAKEDFQRAMDHYRDVDDPEGVVRVLHNLGLASAKEGDFNCAIGFYLESIRQAEQGGRIPLPMTLNNLGLCYLYMNRLAEGWQIVEKGMALAERVASSRDRNYLIWTKGQFHLHQGSPLKARECFETSLGEAIQTGDYLSQITAHLGMAEAYVRQQDARSAEAAMERALALAGTSLRDPEMLEVALLQVEIDLCAQRPERADQVMKTLGPIKNQYQEFHFRRLSYQGCMATDRILEAEAHWGKLEGLAARYGYPLPARSNDPPPLVPPPALEVACLGHFEAKVDGLTVRSRDWRSGNSKVVLAYLLLNPAGATKDQLLSVLYPDEEPARSAIHTVIGRLRQALEPHLGKGSASRFILFQDGRYYLNRGLNLRFDVMEFQQACQEARNPSLSESERRACLLEAIRLYRGPFMEEFQALTWCMIEGERIRRLAIGAYEGLFAWLAKHHEWTELEAFSDALLTLEPCSELAYRAKMVALVMRDRWEDALRVGQLAIQVLMNSLRQAPEPETNELIDLIRTERLTLRGAQSFLSGQEG